MPSEAEVVPAAGFEPHLFWDQHKSKIIWYGALFLAALVIFGIYQFTTEQRTAASSALLASAAKPEDYRQVIEKYPRTIAAGNAHLLLAKELRDEKKYDDAVATLRTFTQQFSEHPLASAGWLSLGETLALAGKTDEAIETFQQVMSKFPATSSAALAGLELAGSLKTKGKTEEARRAYENVVSQHPESVFAQQATREMRRLHQ